MSEIEIKVERLRDGQHPSEVVVSVETADGKQEKLIVDPRSISAAGTIGVGYPLARDENNHLLVELPRETIRGEWRLWVPSSIVVSTT